MGNRISRKQASFQRDQVLASLLAQVDAREPLVLVKAPPGSGKTYALLHAVRLALLRGWRVAVATQTNAQADDFCQRLGELFRGIPIVRLASSGREPEDLGEGVGWESDARRLPQGSCVVVAPTAKWASAEPSGPFDLLVVDEAWQLPWAEFTMLRHVAGRFVLVGDPGQIAPVVTVDVARWQTTARPPHWPAPEVLLREARRGKIAAFPVLTLPVSTRLAFDTRMLVQSFYDFPFQSWAGPGERYLELAPTRRRAAVDPALELLRQGSLSVLTLPTPADGPPEDDRELAVAAAGAARRLLERKARVCTEEGQGALKPHDIGMVATHRVVNARLSEALGELSQEIRVDTPERWQGLERPVMIAIHPLSSVVRPGEFDLSTGRLCVMTSRHRVGLLLVTRDHITTTLAENAPAAAQPVGAVDEAGQGHARHQQAWRWLEENGYLAPGLARAS